MRAARNSVSKQIESLTLEDTCVIQDFFGGVDVFAPVLTSSLLEPVAEMIDDKVS